MKTADLIKKSHSKRGAPGTLKRKVKGKMTLAKARALKNKPGATTLDKKQANFFINMHSEGLWDNIHKKRARGEKMRKKGEKGAPTPDQIQRAQEDAPSTNTGSVVGAGDNPTGTVVVDKRRRKDKQPKLLKQFRRFIDSDD